LIKQKFYRVDFKIGEYKMYTLKNWSIVIPSFQAPELGKKLHGYVFGNPHFHNGESVTTSYIEDA
jgi:hypothetical protein